jgi:hypothetical protein
MANTTNLDLVKPAGTDHALISVLNSNSDKIDAFAGQTNDSLSAEQNGLAYIVGNTNTTGGTLAVGQFVYVKGHSTIAEGLRKVTASISANGSITTSNTDACSEGGLNALNSNISKFRTFQVQDENELDTALTNYDITCMYLAVLNDGSGMILGQFVSSTYQSQMKLNYWNTKIQRRVKNSANWGSWVDIT